MREVFDQVKIKRHDGLLRQALIGSHLAASPISSPEFQWTVTPDAIRLESGKITQVLLQMLLAERKTPTFQFQTSFLGWSVPIIC